MKRLKSAALLVAAVLVLAGAALLALAPVARALPEYATQTGEPCATCHVGPSGGGLRTPRGQAWVGSHRPGTVPALNDALALLGVHLSVDQADFAAPASAPGAASRPAGIPSVSTGDRPAFERWLSAYEGN